MTSVAESQDGPNPVVAGSGPAFTLFDQRAVALATFLGTPLGGGILMALNYQRLGQARKAAETFVLTLVGTGLLIVIGWRLPTTGLNAAIAAGVLFAIRAVASRLQGGAIRDHLGRGGRLASLWTAAGTGVAVLALLFGMIFTGAYLKERMPAVQFGSSHVYFTGTASRADADALGRVLSKSGYFAKGADVILEKGSSGTKIKFVVKEGGWNDPALMERFEVLGMGLAPSVGGFPIEVDLLNKNREMEMGEAVGRVELNKDHVYYFGDATSEQATTLAHALEDAGYFNGSGHDVCLSNNGDGNVISFVVTEGSWNRPETVASFEQITRRAAAVMGANPVRMRLVDKALNARRSETL